MSETMNRREVLAISAVAAAVCLCGLPCETHAEDAAPPAAPGPLDAGPISDYQTDGIYDKFATKDKKSPRILIVHHDHKLYAMTAICTHKGCTVKPDGTTGFKCPCHKATYDIDGKPTFKAPASLVRYPVSVDDNKHLIIDTDNTKTFDDSHWDEGGSFIKDAGN